MLKIKIAYTYNDSVKNLDPADIKSIAQSNLIENLYSRLLDYNSSGQLECTLCSEFSIEQNVISFKIKSGIKTITGYELTPKDVYTSISRLFELNSNTHGNLTSFVKDKSDLSFDEKNFRIKLIKPHYTQFLLPLLASMDFSIVPSIAIDQNNKIIDHKNTFGPYFVSVDDSTGNLKLNANINHPYYDKNMPQEIKLIYSDPRDVIDGFLQDKFDVIDITIYPRTNLYEKLFSQDKKKFSKSSTIPINLFYLNLKPSTLKNFSQPQLFYALNLIKEKYINFKTYGWGFKEQIEFIPPYGNGHLNNEERSKLEQLRFSKEKPFFDKPIILGVLKPSYEKVLKAFENNPEIKVVIWEDDPSFLPAEKRPDVTLQVTDSSFNEDISLLSYNFSMENFGFSRNEGLYWIQEYVKLEKKSDRITKLQSLFYDLLSKPIIYPIGASPYWAIGREDLELNFPTLFPGSHWWKIRKI